MSEGHLNTFALSHIPPIVLLAVRGLSGFPQITGRSTAFVAGASLLYGLLFSTCFYMAWMFALTLLIAALYTGLTFRRETASLVRVHAKDIFVLFGTAAACFVIGLVPLYVIYAPVLQVFPGRSFREYISFAPFP
jgi:hypothetical protein